MKYRWVSALWAVRARDTHSSHSSRSSWAPRRRSRRHWHCLGSRRILHSNSNSSGRSAAQVVQSSGRTLRVVHCALNWDTCAYCWAPEPAPAAWTCPRADDRGWRCARCVGIWHDDSGTRPEEPDWSLQRVPLLGLVNPWLTCTRASLRCTLVASSSRTNASG